MINFNIPDELMKELDEEMKKIDERVTEYPKYYNPIGLCVPASPDISAPTINETANDDYILCYGNKIYFFYNVDIDKLKEDIDSFSTSYKAIETAKRFDFTNQGEDIIVTLPSNTRAFDEYLLLKGYDCKIYVGENDDFVLAKLENISKCIIHSPNVTNGKIEL